MQTRDFGLSLQTVALICDNWRILSNRMSVVIELHLEPFDGYCVALLIAYCNCI